MHWLEDVQVPKSDFVPVDGVYSRFLEDRLHNISQNSSRGILSPKHPTRLEQSAAGCDWFGEFLISLHNFSRQQSVWNDHRLRVQS